MISLFPIINDLNNNRASGYRPMPIKDITSDGTSTFAMGRQVFARSYVENPSTALKPPVIGIEGYLSKNRILPTVFDSTHTAQQKKWIGGIRDSSQRTATLASTAVGVSLNQSQGPYSYTSYTETNTVRNAKIRTRCGGSVAPIKCNYRVVGGIPGR